VALVADHHGPIASIDSIREVAGPLEVGRQRFVAVDVVAPIEGGDDLLVVEGVGRPDEHCVERRLRKHRLVLGVLLICGHAEPAANLVAERRIEIADRADGRVRVTVKLATDGGSDVAQSDDTDPNRPRSVVITHTIPYGLQSHPSGGIASKYLHPVDHSSSISRRARVRPIRYSSPFVHADPFRSSTRVRSVRPRESVPFVSASEYQRPGCTNR